MNSAVDPLAQLTEIRAIMERSSRFLSLSGLSGIAAGVVALAGVGVGYWYLGQEYGSTQEFVRVMQASEPERLRALPFLLGLAGALFCWRCWWLSILLAAAPNKPTRNCGALLGGD
ncbi:hypothetical protein [Hymenobacter radiodurans]|uniref:hypothetical protein n=1 Tax=Hymenobacter radiodurans TaxID=2496028 RepID=UPI001F11702D|nr:hypothetical protein [Hymenobacter radiodurans]